MGNALFAIGFGVMAWRILAGSRQSFAAVVGPEDFAGGMFISGLGLGMVILVALLAAFACVCWFACRRLGVSTHLSFVMRFSLAIAMVVPVLLAILVVK